MEGARISSDAAEVKGMMMLSASLNGENVMEPAQMFYCSYAMELWPYVAVCGRVTAVRLLV